MKERSCLQRILGLILYGLIIYVGYTNAFDLIGLPFEVVIGRKTYQVVSMSTGGLYGITEKGKLYNFVDWKWDERNINVSSFINENLFLLTGAEFNKNNEIIRMVYDAKTGITHNLKQVPAYDNWKIDINNAIKNGGRAFYLSDDGGQIYLVGGVDLENNLDGYVIDFVGFTEQSLAEYNPDILFIAPTNCKEINQCSSPSGNFFIDSSESKIFSVTGNKVFDKHDFAKLFGLFVKADDIQILGWVNGNDAIYVRIGKNPIPINYFLFQVPVRFPSALIKVQIPFP